MNYSFTVYVYFLIVVNSYRKKKLSTTVESHVENEQNTPQPQSVEEPATSQ